MQNWKTTTLGVLTILGVVVHVGTQVLNGNGLSMTELSASAAGITTGWGLIHAADAKPTTPAAK